MKEFSFIEFLSKTKTQTEDVSIGIGDDAAVIKIPVGYELVVSTDTLNQGIHFPENTLPQDISYKALAVSLSDLAAMGALPKWVLVNLSTPSLEPSWIEPFLSGLFELIQPFNLQLIGGDTCRGPLHVTTTVLGIVPSGKALTRFNAKVGDKIYVTGTVGDSGLALKHLAGASPFCLQRLNRPTARVKAGNALRDLVNSCIDISDGLAQDLGHILNQSHVGASIFVEQLPLSDELKKIEPREAWQLALTSGDDYELCFTSDKMLPELDVPVSCIGTIEQEKGLRIKQQNGEIVQLPFSGYDHFSKEKKNG